MTDDPEAGSGGDPSYLDEIDGDAVEDPGRLQVTPEQHQQLKNRLHATDHFADIRRADRRYLVVGSGGDDPQGQRRLTVCELLDDRPGATAFRLEDFGFTGADIDLWAPAFDILSGMATHVVGVVEDFDGGYVWELGFLYHEQAHVRDILWLLKRVYETEAEMRAQYDNGMAASHMAVLEEAAGDRVLTWADPEELPAVVDAIP